MTPRSIAFDPHGGSLFNDKRSRASSLLVDNLGFVRKLTITPIIDLMSHKSMPTPYILLGDRPTKAGPEHVRVQPVVQLANLGTRVDQSKLETWIPRPLVAKFDDTAIHFA